MQQVDSFVDPLRKLITEHKYISEFLEFLEEITGFLHEEGTSSKVKQIEDFFRRIIDHFQFEEETIFPPILSECATSETIKLILNLQKEHGIILRKMEEFQKAPSEENITLLDKMGTDIMDRILAHASKEDDELLPILQKNRQIFGLPDEN